MRSKPGAALKGVQRPRSFWVPPCVSGCGEEALEVCELGGLRLDPWQSLVLASSLGEREDGTWAALEVGEEVSRQNGKGGTILARQLAGLFLLEEENQIYSAHRYDTSMEAFRRLRIVIESTPDFDREVHRIVKSHGEEGIELTGNRRIGFRTRAGGGGRGLTGDTLYLDEAMILSEDLHGDLFPVQSARPNPQIWYAGSAVNQLQHEHGKVFARIRKRGLRGGEARLAWFSWGQPPDENGTELSPDDAGELLDDPKKWAAANPALGIRISRDFIEAERRSMNPRNFAVERLGIGDWPDPDEGSDELIDREVWKAILDREVTITGSPALAVDVSPDRSSSAIAAAGRREDRLIPVELLERRRGTGWVVGRLAELVDDHGVAVVVIDGRGPAASLIKEIEEAIGFEVTVISTAEYAQACGGFFDEVGDKTLRHGGQEELDAAVRGAAVRPLSEAWAWSRKKSDVDITPLVACTLARWGVVSQGEEGSVYEERGVVVL